MEYIFEKCMMVNTLLKSKRVHLIWKTLDILARVQIVPDYLDKFILCYKLLFDSVGLPRVSCQEIHSLLQYTLPVKYHDVALQIVNNFRRLSPDAPEVPEPRSLKHYCRTRIRNVLHQGRNLPYGVSSLGLPDSLKKYILLSDDTDFRIVLVKRRLCPDGNVRDLPAQTVDTSSVQDCILSYVRNM